MKILSAALRLPGRYVVTLPAPARHHDLRDHARELGFTPADVRQSEPGFWTDEGTYVGREQAAAIAEAAGQHVWVAEMGDLQTVSGDH